MPGGGGYIAINNFLKGTGWGKEKDVPVPEQWKMENAGKAFAVWLEDGVRMMHESYSSICTRGSEIRDPFS